MAASKPYVSPSFSYETLEEMLENGTVGGYTPQYVHVTCEGGAPGEIVNVYLESLTKEGMAGRRIESYPDIAR